MVLVRTVLSRYHALVIRRPGVQLLKAAPKVDAGMITSRLWSGRTRSTQFCDFTAPGEPPIISVVATCGKEGTTPVRLQRESTWMIPSRVAGCTDAREYWESRHGRLDFENVYSVTEDPVLRREIIGLLMEALDPLTLCRILVPGCGARALLERDLVMSVPG
jgi:hypothetical protein